MTTSNPEQEQRAQTIIDFKDRLEFYQYFNNDVNVFVLVENNLYEMADRQIKDYNGGFWNFHYSNKYECPFFELDTPQKTLHLMCSTNFFDGEVEAFEASVAISCLLFNRFCWHYAKKANDTKDSALRDEYMTLERLFEGYFYALRQMAIDHNYSDFFRFLD